jgi:invasion protein IalB
MQFSTCLPNDCLGPVCLLTIATGAMKQAKPLKALRHTIGKTGAGRIPFSLDGFTATLARIAEPAK